MRRPADCRGTVFNLGTGLFCLLLLILGIAAPCPAQDRAADAILGTWVVAEKTLTSKYIAERPVLRKDIVAKGGR